MVTTPIATASNAFTTESKAQATTMSDYGTANYYAATDEEEGGSDVASMHPLPSIASNVVPYEIREDDCATTVSSMPSILPHQPLYPSTTTVLSVPTTSTSSVVSASTTSAANQWQGHGLDPEEEEMLKIIEARARQARVDPAASATATTHLSKVPPSNGKGMAGSKKESYASFCTPEQKQAQSKRSVEDLDVDDKKKKGDPLNNINEGAVGVGVTIDPATEDAPAHDGDRVQVVLPIEGVPGAHAIGSNLPPSTASDVEDLNAEDEDEQEQPASGDEEEQALDAVLVAEVRPRPTPSVNHQNSRSSLQEQPLTDLERATPMQDERETKCIRENKLALSAIVLLVAAAILLVLGILGVFRGGGDDDISPTTLSNGSNSSASTETFIDPFSSPTLKRIQEEGILKCVYQEPFNFFWTGLDNSLCQAVAAAANAEVKHVSTLWINTLEDLREGRVDILANLVAQTMDRGVHAFRGDAGFAFSVPYLYGGMKVLGDPFFVQECAEKDFRHLGECKDLRVCVAHKSIQEITIKRMLPPRSIVKIDGMLILLQSVKNITALLDSQACNVIAMEGTYLSDSFVQLQGYVGTFTLGKRVFSKDMAAVATRSNDPIFSDFVKTVVQALLEGDSLNFTKANANTTVPQTQLFGPGYENMLRRAIAANGNYDEIFTRTMAPFLPPSEFYGYHAGSPAEFVQSIPFGFISHPRNLTAAPLGRHLQGILDRGTLRCGVELGRPGFANELTSGYQGIEIDLCRGLAASLFQGDANAVMFVPMHDASKGYAMLVDGEVDVVAGARWTVENDIKEPTTGMGFSFSRPYFYGETPEEGDLSLATRQDDHDWQSFVSWYVMSLRYAEEQGIDRLSSNDMPLVSVFGPLQERFFRDAVLAVGSYAELYENNLQVHIPRAGRNAVNSSAGRTNADPFLVPGLFH